MPVVNKMDSLVKELAQTRNEDGVTDQMSETMRLSKTRRKHARFCRISTSTNCFIRRMVRISSAMPSHFMKHSVDREGTSMRWTEMIMIWMIDMAGVKPIIYLHSPPNTKNEQIKVNSMTWMVSHT